MPDFMQTTAPLHSERHCSPYDSLHGTQDSSIAPPAFRYFVKDFALNKCNTWYRARCWYLSPVGAPNRRLRDTGVLERWIEEVERDIGELAGDVVSVGDIVDSSMQLQ